jgi:hypothetical protein
MPEITLLKRIASCFFFLFIRYHLVITEEISFCSFIINISVLPIEYKIDWFTNLVGAKCLYALCTINL